MSQAARISNFLENFARNSNDSIHSPSISTEKLSPSNEHSDFDYVDVETIAVPTHNPRLSALSREGSVRSSFDIYKIKEESDEETSKDSPRSAEDNSTQPTKSTSDDLDSSVDEANLICSERQLPQSHEIVDETSTSSELRGGEETLEASSQLTGLTGSCADNIYDDDLFIPDTELHVEDYSFNNKTSNQIIACESVEREQLSPPVSHERCTGVSLSSVDDEVFVSGDVGTDSADFVASLKEDISESTVDQSSFRDEGFCSYSEYADRSISSSTGLSLSKSPIENDNASLRSTIAKPPSPASESDVQRSPVFVDLIENKSQSSVGPEIQSLAEDHCDNQDTEISVFEDSRDECESILPAPISQELTCSVDNLMVKKSQICIIPTSDYSDIATGDSAELSPSSKHLFTDSTLNDILMSLSQDVSLATCDNPLDLNVVSSDIPVSGHSGTASLDSSSSVPSIDDPTLGECSTSEIADTHVTLCGAECLEISVEQADIVLSVNNTMISLSPLIIERGYENALCFHETQYYAPTQISEDDIDYPNNADINDIQDNFQQIIHEVVHIPIMNSGSDRMINELNCKTTIVELEKAEERLNASVVSFAVVTEEAAKRFRVLLENHPVVYYGEDDSDPEPRSPTSSERTTSVYDSSDELSQSSLHSQPTIICPSEAMVELEIIVPLPFDHTAQQSPTVSSVDYCHGSTVQFSPISACKQEEDLTSFEIASNVISTESLGLQGSSSAIAGETEDYVHIDGIEMSQQLFYGVVEETITEQLSLIGGVQNDNPNSILQSFAVTEYLLLESATSYQPSIHVIFTAPHALQSCKNITALTQCLGAPLSVLDNSQRASEVFVCNVMQCQSHIGEEFMEVGLSSVPVALSTSAGQIPVRKTHLDYSKSDRSDISRQHTISPTTTQHISLHSSELCDVKPLTIHSLRGEITDLSNLLIKAKTFCDAVAYTNPQSSHQAVESISSLLLPASCIESVGTGYPSVTRYDSPNITQPEILDASCASLSSAALYVVSKTEVSDSSTFPIHHLQQTSAKADNTTPTKLDDRTPKVFYADLKVRLIRDQLQTKSPLSARSEPILNPFDSDCQSNMEREVSSDTNILLKQTPDEIDSNADSICSIHSKYSTSQERIDIQQTITPELRTPAAQRESPILMMEGDGVSDEAVQNFDFDHHGLSNSTVESSSPGYSIQLVDVPSIASYLVTREDNLVHEIPTVKSNLFSDSSSESSGADGVDIPIVGHQNKSYEEQIILSEPEPVDAETAPMQPLKIENPSTTFDVSDQVFASENQRVDSQNVKQLPLDILQHELVLCKHDIVTESVYTLHGCGEVIPCKRLQVMSQNVKVSELETCLEHQVTVKFALSCAPDPKIDTSNGDLKNEGDDWFVKNTDNASNETAIKYSQDLETLKVVETPIISVAKTPMVDSYANCSAKVSLNVASSSPDSSSTFDASAFSSAHLTTSMPSKNVIGKTPKEFYADIKLKIIRDQLDRSAKPASNTIPTSTDSVITDEQEAEIVSVEGLPVDFSPPQSSMATHFSSAGSGLSIASDEESDGAAVVSRSGSTYVKQSLPAKEIQFSDDESIADEHESRELAVQCGNVQAVDEPAFEVGSGTTEYAIAPLNTVRLPNSETVFTETHDCDEITSSEIMRVLSHTTESPALETSTLSPEIGIILFPQVAQLLRIEDSSDDLREDGQVMLPTTSLSSTVPVISDSTQSVSSIDSAILVVSADSTSPVMPADSTPPVTSDKSAIPATSIDSAMPDIYTDGTIPVTSADCSISVASVDSASALPVTFQDNAIPVSPEDSVLPVTSAESKISIWSVASIVPVTLVDSSITIDSVATTAPYSSVNSIPRSSAITHSSTSSSPSIPPLSSVGQTPKEFYADIKLKIIRDQLGRSAKPTSIVIPTSTDSVITDEQGAEIISVEGLPVDFSPLQSSMATHLSSAGSGLSMASDEESDGAAMVSRSGSSDIKQSLPAQEVQFFDGENIADEHESRELAVQCGNAQASAQAVDVPAFEVCTGTTEYAIEPLSSVILPNAETLFTKTHDCDEITSSEIMRVLSHTTESPALETGTLSPEISIILSQVAQLSRIEDSSDDLREDGQVMLSTTSPASPNSAVPVTSDSIQSVSFVDSAILVVSADSTNPVMPAESSIPVTSDKSTILITSIDGAMPDISINSTIPVTSADCLIPVASVDSASAFPVISPDGAIPVSPADNALPVIAAGSQISVSSVTNIVPVTSVDSSITIDSVATTAPYPSVDSIPDSSMITHSSPSSSPSAPLLFSAGQTPKEFYADIKLQIIRDQLATDTSPNEKLRKFKEKIEGNSAPKSWRTSLNNNEKNFKDSSAEMKLKVSSFSAGLKSTPPRTTMPVFTTKLRNHYGRQGDTLKLQCRVDGEPRPVVNWSKEGKPLMESQKIQMFEKNGSYILEITDTMKDDSGRYTVKAMNSKGTAHCSADVEIAAKKTRTVEEKTPKSITATFRTPSVDDKIFHESLEISKEVDKFHSEANDIMAELDSMTPCSPHTSHVTHSSHCSPPSFTLDLKDCEVEEGASLDLTCTTEGEDPGLDHSPPQFVKILHDEVVTEGDSVTIECKNPQDDHGMQITAPQFTQKLTDQEVTEGDSVTIEVHGSHDYHDAAAPRFVQELQDEEVIEGESVTIQCKSPHHASSTGAPVFVEKLHDLVAEEGSSLTLECQSPASKIVSSTECSPPSFITQLEDHEVEEGDSVTIECIGPHDHLHSHSHKTEYHSQTSPAHEHEHLTDTTQTNLQSSSEASPPRFVKDLEDDEVEEGLSVTISCKSPAQTSPSQKPVFVQNLTNQEVEEGESLTLSCTNQQNLVQSSPPKFVKELTDEEINEGESLVIECSQLSPPVASSVSSSAAGTSPTSQTLAPSISKDLSDVSVIVGHQAELIMETSDATPEAQQPEVQKLEEPVDPKPKILQELPEALKITDDSVVELVCRISNVSPDDVTWTKNDRMARKGMRFKTTGEGDTFTYTISDCMSIDKGLYRVTASTKHGEVCSSCTITYSSFADSPDIILDNRQSARNSRLAATAASMTTPRFTKHISDVTVNDGELTTLECRVDASNIPRMQWLCNNIDIKPSDNYEMTLIAGLAKLTIKQTHLADQGRYIAVATNDAGSDKTSCFVNVQKRFSSSTVRQASVSNVTPINVPPFSSKPTSKLGSFFTGTHKNTKIASY